MSLRQAKHVPGETVRIPRWSPGATTCAPAASAHPRIRSSASSASTAAIRLARRIHPPRKDGNARECLAVNDKDAVFRDWELPGFGLRVYPSGAKVYSRPDSLRRPVVARHRGTTRGCLTGPSPQESRSHNRPHQGRRDPSIPVASKAAPTMAELAERYQHEYVVMRRRPATVAHYRTMLAKHIVPALGELKVDEVCSVWSANAPSSAVRSTALPAREDDRGVHRSVQYIRHPFIRVATAESIFAELERLSARICGT